MTSFGLSMGMPRPLTSPGGGGGASLLEQVLAESPAWVFDASVAANLATDTAGTTPVSAAGQTVAFMSDLSGNGHHATQATAASRPVYRGVPRTLGPELSPAFSTWTLPTGWSESAGVLTKTAGTANAASGAIAFDAGSTYMVVLNITRTAGTLTIRTAGGTAVISHGNNSSRSTIWVFTAGAGNTAIELSADASFAGTVTKCSVREVLTMTNFGVAFDGQDDLLQTNAIDLSGSNKATVSTMLRWHGGQGASSRAYDAGNYTPGAGNGSFYMGRQSQNLGFCDGATICTANQPLNEVEGLLRGAQAQINTLSLDRAGATIADQIKCRERGHEVTLTTAGVALDDEGLANGVLSIGGANNGLYDFYGLFGRQVGFSGAATPEQIAIFEAYCREGYAIGAVLGDSTTAACGISFGQSSDNWRVSSLVGGLIVNGADISKPGDRIANQLAAW